MIVPLMQVSEFLSTYLNLRDILLSVLRFAASDYTLLLYKQ